MPDGGWRCLLLRRLSAAGERNTRLVVGHFCSFQLLGESHREDGVVGANRLYLAAPPLSLRLVALHSLEQLVAELVARHVVSSYRAFRQCGGLEEEVA